MARPSGVRLFIGVLMALWVVLPCGCRTSVPKYVPGVAYYFRGMFVWAEPKQLWAPVSEAQAEAAPNYFEAYFDSSAKLVKVVSYVGGHLEWTVDYCYRSDGTALRGVFVGSRGDTTIQSFDERRHLIVPERK